MRETDRAPGILQIPLCKVARSTSLDATIPIKGDYMTGHDFQVARLALGLSQTQLGKVLKVSVHTISTWEHREWDVPAWAAEVLDWLKRGEK